MKNVKINEAFIEHLKENVKYPKLVDLSLYECKSIEGFTFLSKKFSDGEFRFLNEYLEKRNVSMIVTVKPYNDEFLKVKLFRRKKL